MDYKLIVADSSPSIQKAIRMAFTDSEFEIYPFEDGLEVVKSIIQINPDAVLMSLSLSHKDGYEVGFYMKSQEELKHAPLVLLKGAFEQLEKEKISSLNYDEIVQEPFDSERLVRIVRNLIEGRRNPKTLPEEPLMGEITAADSTLDHRQPDSQKRPLSQDVALSGEKPLSSLSPGLKAEVEEKVRDLVRGEILGIQRELEKRIKAQVLSELKELIRRELQKEETHNEQ